MIIVNPNTAIVVEVKYENSFYKQVISDAATLR